MKSKNQKKGNIYKALESLYGLIRAGWEFPTACDKVCQRFGLEYEKLRDAYDASESNEFIFE